jgi:hypothetical protein
MNRSFTAILEKLSLNKPYKYVLYLAGIILVLATFVPTHGYDVRVIQSVSFKFIILGLIVWMIDELFRTVATMAWNWDEKGAYIVILFLELVFIFAIIFGWLSLAFNFGLF